MNGEKGVLDDKRYEEKKIESKRSDEKQNEFIVDRTLENTLEYLLEKKKYLQQSSMKRKRFFKHQFLT